MMWSTLIIKELREISRDGRFRLAVWILLGLFAASAVFSVTYYRRLAEQHTAAAREARTIWENQGAKNPHNAAHYGYYAFKPVYGLGAFDPGIDKFLGVSLFLEAHRQNMDEHEPARDEQQLIRMEPFSPMFVLIYLAPLLILLLGYGSVTSEYESGRWRLLLSQGVPVVRLLLGKAAGIAVAFFLLILPLLGLMAGLVFGMFGVGEGELLRFGLIALALLLYYGIFINLSVLISALSRSSSQSLVIVTATYIVMVWLAPRLAVNLAEQAYPVPTMAEYEEAVERDLENGIDGHDPYNKFAEQLQAEVLARHGVDSIQDLPFNWWGFVLQKGEEHEKVVFDKHMNELRNLYRRQLQVHRNMSILSPALLARNIGMAMARTDVESYYHFQAEAEAYRIQLVGELNKDLEVNSRFDDWDYQAPEAFFAGNRKFEYSPVALTTTWEQTGWLFLLLAAWFAGSAGLLWLVKKS